MEKEIEVLQKELDEVKKQAESLRMKLISEAQQEAQQKLKAEKANAEMEEFLHENRALVTKYIANSLVLTLDTRKFKIT